MVRPLRPSRPPDPPDPTQRTERQAVEAHDINASITPTPNVAEEQDVDVWSSAAVSKLRQEFTAEARALEEQTRELYRMYHLATCEYPLHADSAIRAMTDDEKARQPSSPTCQLEYAWEKAYPVSRYYGNWQQAMRLQLTPRSG
ncbi:unnamed protein product [Peronospora farinosa]|uniref:Uncharacterized protein n=1 Tax=Peronospora farinosa TaxID=134698 RepID=A0AAV0T0U7_9STRA|nr:unnamed protein product [Peronospora farinosa]